MAFVETEYPRKRNCCATGTPPTPVTGGFGLGVGVGTGIGAGIGAGGSMTGGSVGSMTGESVVGSGVGAGSTVGESDVAGAAVREVRARKEKARMKMKRLETAYFRVTEILRITSM